MVTSPEEIILNVRYIFLCNCWLLKQNKRESHSLALLHFLFLITAILFNIWRLQKWIECCLAFYSILHYWDILIPLLPSFRFISSWWWILADMDIILTCLETNEGPHRWSNLTTDEQKTQVHVFMLVQLFLEKKKKRQQNILCNWLLHFSFLKMTLWAMARSPLMFGGDMRKLDNTTYNIIAHPDLLRINALSGNNKEVCCLSTLSSNNILVVPIMFWNTCVVEYYYYYFIFLAKRGWILFAVSIRNCC